MYRVVTNQKHQTMLMIIAAFALFMDSLDGSIVNVAMPVIAAEFGIDISAGSWVVMVYMLIMAGFMLAFGRVADNGRIQQIFAIGFFTFSLGSLLSAISPTFIFMIVARGIQGLGASMIAAAAPLLITRFLPEGKRGLGMGVIATTGGIALALGPPIGGILTAYLSWHWMFLINVPIGIAAIAFAKAIIPKPECAPKKEPFDWKGTWLMFVAIASFILFLERGPSLGWTSIESLVTAGIFLVSIIWFIAHSLRSDNPLLNVRIFKHWKFSAVALSYLLTCGVFAGVMYMVPYYMQTSLGLDTAASGFILMISAVLTAIVGIPVGAWSDRVGCRTPCILAALFRISFCLIFLFILPEWGLFALIPGIICMGLSFGISGGPATTRIVQFSPKGEEGMGTSVMITTDFLGGVLGLAAYVVMFSIAVPASVNISVANLSSELFVTGFHATAALGLAFGIITLILSAVVPNFIARREGEDDISKGA